VVRVTEPQSTTIPISNHLADTAGDSPEQLMTLWQEAVARSRSAVAEALTRDGLGQLARYTTSSGESPSLRRVLIDIIEEYARHNGHADLIRESVDGLVGEDPPR
jgi:hypothetical protein